MEKRLSNTKYKLFLIFLISIPMILCGIYFLEIVLGRFKIDCSILSIFSFTSILPLLFFYSASYVFQFCEYHRMFLHYIAFITLYHAIDLYYRIPIDSAILFTSLMIITFIFMIITLYKYLKHKKGGNYGNNS